MKTCRKCGKTKDLSEFFRKTSSKDGYDNACKDCKNKYHKEYCKKYRPIIKRDRRLYDDLNKDDRTKKRYLRTYGISVKGKERLLKEQRNMCAICGVGLRFTTGHVDHSHKTDRVRGILCKKCNTILGMCDDSKELLKKAINYLEERDE